jgi:hypothetical protein
MHFVASINEFAGAAVVGAGFGVGWIAAQWLFGAALSTLKR